MPIVYSESLLKFCTFFARFISSDMLLSILHLEMFTSRTTTKHWG